MHRDVLVERAPQERIDEEPSGLTTTIIILWPEKTFPIFEQEILTGKCKSVSVNRNSQTDTHYANLQNYFNIELTILGRGYRSPSLRSKEYLAISYSLLYGIRSSYS